MTHNNDDAPENSARREARGRDLIGQQFTHAAPPEAGPDTPTFESTSHARMRKHLENIERNHVNVWAETRLSIHTSHAQRLIDRYPVVAAATLGLVALLLWGAVRLRATLDLAPDSMWAALYIAATMTGVVGLLIAGGVLRYHWVKDVVILGGRSGRSARYLLEAFDEAEATLADCADEHITGAATALKATREMEPGLEELAVELARFTQIEAAHRRYVSADYGQEAARIADELTRALAAAVADVETSAKLLFNQRDTLAVRVPEQLERTPVLPQLQLSAQAQQALEDARRVLRAHG